MLSEAMDKRERKAVALALLIEQPLALSHALDRLEQWIEAQSADELCSEHGFISDLNLTLAHCRATSDMIVLHAMRSEDQVNAT